METIKQIEKAQLPAFKENIRDLTRKEWSLKIRGLFKEMGFKKISVRTPNHSMASSVSISLPSLQHDHQSPEERQGCADCTRRYLMTQKIEKIVLAAFPDLEDRSEYQTDYFDFCLMVD